MVEELYPWNLFNAILEIDADWIKGRFSEDHKAGLTYAVSTLGVVEQEVIRLRYRESKSYEEIQDMEHSDLHLETLNFIRKRDSYPASELENAWMFLPRSLC